MSGQRKYYRTEIKLHPCSWNANTQKAVYVDKKKAKALSVDFSSLSTFKEVEDYNSYLQKLIVTITEAEKRFKMDNIAYSVEMVIEKLNNQKKAVTKKEDASNVFFDLLQKYIMDHEDFREKGGLSTYKSVKTHLQNYCKATGKKLTFENIDYAFFQSFQTFLLQDRKVMVERDGEIKEKTIKGLNNTTIAKRLSTIKSFLNYAKREGISVSDKYKDFKLTAKMRDNFCRTHFNFCCFHVFDISLSNCLHFLLIDGIVMGFLRIV